MFDPKKPTTQMLGRWQPWHAGHTELFKRALAETGQVCIMVRDVQGIDDNPFDYGQTLVGIRKALWDEGYTENQEYIVMRVPNIVDISYGRGVGYSFTEHDLGKEIHDISATKIRNQMRKEGSL
jgi:nicotinic acid mononucleotide adenylyltransferase